MTQHVLFISLTGITVVFGFLIIMYFILSSFKYFFHNKSQAQENNKNNLTNNSVNSNKRKGANIDAEGDIPSEVIAAILSSLDHYHEQNLSGDQIIIKKRG